MRSVSLFRPMTLPYHFETPSKATIGVTSAGPAISRVDSRSMWKAPVNPPARRQTTTTDIAAPCDRQSHARYSPAENAAHVGTDLVLQILSPRWTVARARRI